MQKNYPARRGERQKRAYQKQADDDARRLWPLKEYTLMTSKTLIAAPLFVAAALLAGSVVAAPASTHATKAPAASTAKPAKAHKHHKTAEKTAQKPA